MCPTSAGHGSRLFSIAYLVLVLCEGIPSPQDCLPLRLVEIAELYAALYRFQIQLDSGERAASFLSQCESQSIYSGCCAQW